MTASSSAVQRAGASHIRPRFGRAVAALVVIAALAACSFPPGRSATAEDLVAAAQAGDLGRISECLAAGVPVDARPERPWPVGGFGPSALVVAAGSDRADVVRRLLDAGADVNQAPPSADTTPIAHAAGRGSAEVVDLLLARGADPGRVTARSRWPALHCAAMAGRTDVVLKLLDGCADPGLEVADGRRAVHVAVEGNHLGVARTLAARDPAPDPFVAAALGPAAQFRAMLAAHPAWVKASPGPLSDVPLLQLAARCGNVEGVAALLDSGADPDAVDSSRGLGRFSALHHAAREGHIEVARLLLDRGASPDVRMIRGGTPLASAASAGHVDVMRLLLDRGASVNARQGGAGSPTPLHYAAASGHAGAVELLLAHGADTSATAAGGTPLDWALRSNAPDSVTPLRRAK